MFAIKSEGNYSAQIILLILLVSILVNRLGLNSRNSSKPPVADPYRKKVVKTAGGRKTGGQPGHLGKTLKRVTNPDIVKPIPVDRTSLPPGKYRQVGHETRQVIDVAQSMSLPFRKESPGRYNTALG